MANMSGDPYRTPAKRTEQDMADESPEAILFDTLQRLNSVDEDDARRVVRGLAAFVGFNVNAADAESIDE